MDQPQKPKPQLYQSCLNLIAGIFVVALGITIGVVFLTGRGRQDSTDENDTSSHPSYAPSEPEKQRFSLTDIEIGQWRLTQEYGVFWIRGILRNKASIPLAVVLQAIGWDPTGQAIYSTEFYPASTDNIAPGAYHSIGFPLSDAPAQTSRVTLEVLKVFQWK